MAAPVKESKSLWHSALVQMGPVTVEVVKEAQKSKYEGKSDYVVLKIDGKERLYSCENPSCAAFFDGTAGQSFVLQAEGSRDEAILNYVDAQAPAAPPPRPAARPPAARPPFGTRPPPAAQHAAQRPAAAQNHAPMGVTVGMAINNAVSIWMNEESWGPNAIKRVTEIASDILRISAWLEAGNLTPKAGSPKPAAPEPEPVREPQDMPQEEELFEPPF